MVMEAINRVAEHCVVPVPWTIKTSPVDGHRYVVFTDPHKAYQWSWFFYKTLGLRLSCYGMLDNAYGPF